jgi:hypothetical protein
VRIRYETAPGGYWAGGRPSWIHGYPISERNLMKIMNDVSYNTDVSQVWEWSGRGFRPFDDTNEAYKLGVNYLIYGLTY